MYLGLDIGTSEVKALLLDGAHRIIGTAGATLEVQRPAPGHSEQHPAAWWQATLDACARLRADHAAEWAVVQAIGLSGQMHGAVLLDARQQVLRPAILWNDTRSAPQCEAMMRENPAAAQLAGSLIMPGFTAPKLRWVAEHEPDVFAQVATVLLPKDFIRLQLTGELAMDMSDASGTAWLDVARRDWSDDLLALTRLNRAHMPRLVEGNAATGTLKPDVAAVLGLGPQVLVAGGGGDNAASAVGIGAVDAGQGFVSLGTSGVIFVVTPSYQPNVRSATHAFCHALPQRWHQMSVMLSAASCLQWAAPVLGYASVAAMEADIAALPLAQRVQAPVFLPYLSGERTPHNSGSLRGGFQGLSHDSTRATLAYAVMEGVSFGLADGLQALRTAGVRTEALSLVGGGARSRFWAQLLASALGLEILTHSGSEAGGALGAARLGWLASDPAAHLVDVCPPPPVAARYAPQADEAAVLQARLAEFRRRLPAGA
jgi:xylulokinase